MDTKKAKIFLKECMRQHGVRSKNRYTADQYKQTLGALRDAFEAAKEAYALSGVDRVTTYHSPQVGIYSKVVGLKEPDPLTGLLVRIDESGGDAIKNPHGIPLRFEVNVRANQHKRAPTVMVRCNWDDMPANKR